MKKIIAILLLSVLCLSFTACGEDAPDGMHDVTIDGEPFILYVPVSWTENMTSGVSGAFFSALDNISVSARYVTDEREASEYMLYASEQYKASLKDFEELAGTTKTIAEKNALCLRFNYTDERTNVKFTSHQYFIKYKGDIIIIAFYSPTDKIEGMTEHMDMILDNFVLRDKAEVTGDALTDKHTPEGMKIASADHLEYRLYVPNTWVCRSDSGVSEAYFPSSEHANVTLTSYSPDSEISLKDHVSDCLTRYSENLAGYTEIGMKERVLLDREALSYTYLATYEGVTYKIMQTTLLYNGIFYTITYTALESDFAAHTDDVEAMINAFTFR